MSRSDPKKGKIAVPQAGQGPALKHNPFGQLAGAPAAEAPAAVPPAAEATAARSPEPRGKSRGRLVLRREKKGRGGKTVVVVAGLRASAHLSESEIDTLARLLRQQLGCGGSSERVPNDTVIVVQGDQPARVAEVLRAQGFQVGGVTE